MTKRRFNTLAIIAYLVILIFFVILVASCDKGNDTECDKITEDYHNALQYAVTPQAREELKRQYEQRLNKSGC